MKRKKGNYVLTEREFILLQSMIEQYGFICEYVKQKLLGVHLLSTQQLVEQYCVSRQTVYRICKAGFLLPVVKHRCYYFDAEEAKDFFFNYWGK
ncbi:helix-turn-helix domain-containing protein [Pedobacter sp. ASV28]|uniref:helix-turn-helix domain-containing protein n=1 Tax=Pedobacter sp. ASV28 TaxID=2795123 RepID=UPI0018EA7CE3|nr:helix-turn-helix domain-containing protein [Pedobacter sp. ASV28]